ncbi:MAG: hypothetical protein HDR08_02485 [Lachnospiraceae bacterium]|nr:hypothetical protein [Lachnospiraceae bacterium]
MKKKILKIAAITIALLLLLFPLTYHYKDGGTVEYRALLYQVYDVHSLRVTGGYDEGTIIKILGFEVFNNVNYE